MAWCTVSQQAAGLCSPYDPIEGYLNSQFGTPFTSPGVPTPTAPIGPPAPSYQLPKLPAVPALPNTGIPAPGTVTDSRTGQVIGSTTTEPGSATSPCDQQYPPGLSRFWCKLGRNAGFISDNTIGAAANKLASWAQYPVIILLGVAVVVIALVAIARPRATAIIQSDLGRATGSVARGVRHVVKRTRRA